MHAEAVPFFLIRNYLFIRRGEYERLRPDKSDGLDGDPARSELEARPTEASAAEESVRYGTDPEVFLLLRPRRIQSSQICLRTFALSSIWANFVCWMTTSCVFDVFLSVSDTGVY